MKYKVTIEIPHVLFESLIQLNLRAPSKMAAPINKAFYSLGLSVYSILARKNISIQGARTQKPIKVTLAYHEAHWMLQLLETVQSQNIDVFSIAHLDGFIMELDQKLTSF